MMISATAKTLRASVESLAMPFETSLNVDGTMSSSSAPRRKILTTLYVHPVSR